MEGRVLVIGASGQLGHPIASALHESGFHVRVMGRNGERLHSVCFSEDDPSFSQKGKFRRTPLCTTLYFSSEQKFRDPFDSLFTVEERIEFLKKATTGLSGITIDDFNGLVVDYAHKKNAHILIRGLRMISDFEYEFQMALTNRKLAQDIETIFLMPHENYCYLSSKLLKEAISLGADISSFVPVYVYQALKKKVEAGK